MKKSIYVAFALTLMFLTIYSCGGKDDDVVVVDLPGSSWTYYFSSTEQQVEETFYFITKTTYSFKYKYTGEIADSGSTSGVYTYSAPNISIELGVNTLTGTVEDKAMTLQIGNGSKAVYVKEE